MTARQRTQGARLSVWDSTILLSGLALTLAVLLAVTLTRPELSLYFLCFTVVTALLAIPLVIGCVTRRMDPFDPTTIIAASYFLFFVYAPIRNLMAGQFYFFGELVMPLLPVGSLYLAFGIVGLWAGYYSSGIARRVAESAPSPPASHRGVVRYAWIIAIIAIVCFNAYIHIAGLSWLKLLTLGQLGGVPGAIQTGVASVQSDFSNYLYSTLDWLTSALMLFFAFSRSRRKWILAAFFGLLLIYTTIGFRYRVVILILAPVLYHYLKVNRRPDVVKVAAVAIALMLLIGAIGELRDSFRAGEPVDPTRISLSSSSESFANDLDLYQGYLAIVDAIPREHDYFWGSSLAYLLIQPIPRSLWPDKPAAPVATIVDVILGPDAVIAGIAYPNVGEFYANFGVVGLVIGMWLFGLLARVLYEYLGQHKENDWARIIYSLMFPFLLQVISRGYFVQIFQEAAFLLFPILLGMRICRDPNRACSRVLVGSKALGEPK